MRILELFAGTQSISKVARATGWQAFTSDYDDSFDVDYVVDILHFDIARLPWKPEIIWASPPCESFSVASIGHHWYMGGVPKTAAAEHGLAMLKKTIDIIEQLQPRYYFIENPRGMMRKMEIMHRHPYRHTVTYCQYGDTRMKPTDIWTNCPDFKPLPACRNGAPCHVAAPRGSSTGTQGIKTYRDRSRVPPDLCAEVLQAAQGNVNARQSGQLWLL